MIWLECALVILAFLLAATYPRLGDRWFIKIERRFAGVARRRALAIVLSGVAALALRAAVLPILPLPYPWIPDEQSYLLQADTFAHGRLTNPTHPLWVHFETPNVIQQPTYSSIYYPAQSAFMALGQVVAGHPFWGVWLSVGLMCAAICWMLQGWVSPLWALIGALLCAIRLGAVSYWSNSYFGGAVTAVGGALVLGALPRIKRRQRIGDALLMGLGFALLINSRPYETVFFSVPVVAALGIWMWRNNAEQWPRTLVRVAVPLVVVIAATAAFMFYFFWRTTGNAFVAPYVLNLRTYAVEPNFAWLPLRPTPHYYNDIIRRYWTEWDVGTYYAVRQHPIVSTLFKIFMFWLFYLGPLLSLPLMVFALLKKRETMVSGSRRKFQFLLLVCAANLIGVLLAVPLTPLYLAPSTAAIYGLVVIAMQWVRHWSVRGRPSGIFLVRAIPIVAALLLFARIAIPVFHLRLFNPQGSWTWSASWNELLAREHVEDELKAKPGEHVVIVHYSPQHDPKENWVSNSADIDGSKIVWAQDMAAQNDELLRYFSNRHVWIVNPDERPVQLVPYGTAAGKGGQLPN